MLRRCISLIALCAFGLSTQALADMSDTVNSLLKVLLGFRDLRLSRNPSDRRRRTNAQGVESREHQR
jgi:hypothetical protein